MENNNRDEVQQLPNDSKDGNIENNNHDEVQQPPLVRFGLFFWSIIESIFVTLRAFIFLVVNTLKTLLPSAAMTASDDDKYNLKLIKKLGKLVDDLKLEPAQKEIIKQSWLGQISWVNSRATRERNANELLRWWLIVLGVLIPVLSTNPDAIPQSVSGFLVSMFGIFVAIFTAIMQFRRPEERWRHYRVVTENYLRELWSFIALAGGIYEEFEDHEKAFPQFHQRMTAIRTEDTKKFFGEIVPDTAESTQTVGQGASGAQASNQGE